MLRVWHPDSPGSTVIVRRRWRHRRPFATLTETIVYDEWVLALHHDQVEDARSGPRELNHHPEGTQT